MMVSVIYDNMGFIEDFIISFIFVGDKLIEVVYGILKLLLFLLKFYYIC